MKHLHLPLTAAIIFSLVIVASGQDQHKNQERGFSANGVYASYDIDHINLFSGNLVVAIPIGQEYPVGGPLSYQLKLVYNSYLWSQREVCADSVNFSSRFFTTWVNFQVYQDSFVYHLEAPPLIDNNPYLPSASRAQEDGCYTVQYPNPGANAGMGWQLTFGRLYYPNQDVLSAKDLAVTTEKQDFVYQSPDGSEHTFYPTLHEGEAKVANVFYTRDGSYLRMTKFPEGIFEIQFPNGVIHTFGNAQNGMTNGTELRVTKMRDQFNNWVKIDYTATEWNITDSVGRHHVVTLSKLGNDFSNAVTNVSLDAFNKNSAAYDFGYLTTTINRAYPHVPPNTIDGYTDTVTVPFLTSVKLPDGSKYTMPSGDAYDYTGDLTSTKSIGMLRKLVLPTGGSIEWQYKGESLQDDVIHHYGYPAASSARSYVRTSIGVRRRIVTEGPRSYVWKYDPEPQPAPAFGTNGEDCSPSKQYWWKPVCAPRLFINKVTAPKPYRIQSGTSENGFVTKNYFSYYPHPWDSNGRNASDWHVVEYGLPVNKGVSITDSKGQPLFLSAEVFADANATDLKRSTYVRYETDQWFAADGWGNVAETNARVVAERTVYQDDGGKYSETQYSDFDGLGHYRKVETFGNLGNDTRVITTNYNPGLGTYMVNPVTNTLPAGSTYSGFPTERPWILGTFDQISVTEGGQTSITYFNFDQQGQLTAKRIKRELQATSACPGALCSNDVLVQYSYTNGNLTSESYFGGDRPGHTNLDKSIKFPSLATTAGEYVIDYKYPQCQLSDGTLGTLGVMKQKIYRDPRNNQSAAFKSVDNTVDCSTGLVSSSKDTAGVSTTYTYDVMGRLTDSTPEQGSTQHIDYDPTNNKITVQQQERYEPNPTLTPTYPTGGILGEKVYFYDQLGRLVMEKERLPGVKTPLTAVYIQRNTNYNAMNWVTDVSEFIPDGYSAEGRKTLYENFDPFGRAFKITTPDGHVVTMGYKGVREVTRTLRMGYLIDAAGNVSEQEATTKEMYDRQGRLMTVEEPAGANGQTMSWNYGYNVNNKLTSATTYDPSTFVTQKRFYTYDNMDNLLSASTPERPSVQYADYDTMGRVGKSYDGQHWLTYSYDKTERLKEVRELDGSSTQGRVLKSIVYDTAAGSGLGKIASATRHNYVLNPYPQNVAASSAGSVASASSINTQYGNFNPMFAIDGSRTGAQWGVNGGWMDNTGDIWNDWLQVQFSGYKTIDTVNVFSVQDNYPNPTEPTRSQTFTQYGLIDFQVQYWNGSSWAVLPGGNITNNNLVWRQIKFAPVTASAIRVVVTRGGNSLSRIAEVEALEVPAASQPTVDVAVTEEYTYNGRDGRLSKKLTKMPYSPEVPNPNANIFEQTFAYDQLGNLASQSYPRCLNANCASPNLPGLSAQDRPWTENYEYKNGRIINIGGGPGLNNTTVGNDASFGYHYSGILAAVQHGNGVRDTFDADPNSMQRAYRIYSKKADGTVIWDSGAGAPSGQENYRYDGAGNVVRIGRDWYLYDKVGRVVEGSALITGLKRKYSYDAFGNMTGDKTYNYVTTPVNGSLTQNYTTNAVSSKNQFSLYYDGAGNALGLLPADSNSPPTILYTYDALNMIKSAPGLTYIYGPGDERVWMVNNQDRSNIFETITLRGLGNELLREYQVNGGDRAGHWVWLKDYFYGAGKLIASQSQAGGRHYHLDHLGTVRAITDINGNLVNGLNYQYLPFGEEASAAPPTGERLRFTGHERDVDASGIALDYMHARFYNSRGGKFLSIDPGNDIDPKQPQSWNLYSYVRNNPVNAVDPDGRAQEQQGNITPVPLEIWKDIIARTEAAQVLSPEVFKQIVIAWRLSGLGRVDREAGFTVQDTGKLDGDPTYEVTEAATSNGRNNQAMKLVPGTTDMFHTHPNSSTENPSTPDNYAGKGTYRPKTVLGGGDTNVADKTGRRMWVIHRKALTVYDPKTKKVYRMIEGTKWMQILNGS